jgi:HEAT repeat protein
MAPLHVALDSWFNLSSPATLTTALAHGTPAERAAAARELGERETGADALAAAVADPDAVVRAEAALALGAIGDARARPALVELLQVVEYNHRAALGRLRDPRAVPGLIAALRDLTLGRHAAHYLGWLGGDEAVAPLMAAAGDVRVRTDAYLALGRVATRTHKDEILAFLRARLDEERYQDARRSLEEALRLASAP